MSIKQIYEAITGFKHNDTGRLFLNGSGEELTGHFEIEAANLDEARQLAEKEVAKCAPNSGSMAYVKEVKLKR